KSQLFSGGSKLTIGTPLARINLRTEKNLISELEWIASVEISRNWLSGKIGVRIRERIPVAVFAAANSAPVSTSPRYLASDGVEFSSPRKFENLATISLGKKSLAQRREVAIFVANLPADLVEALTGLEISNTGVILMQSDLLKSGKSGLSIIWGAGNSAADVSVKSRVLKGLLALPENKKITEIDLTIAQSPIVR
ncbi:MAG: FtsQ-type POTRA domain-containing protein, partial [Actinobacteria bacterium]|nr:FtsQ-type POTRA domain-containing protein [Actinomycetota bacterium]